MPKTNAFIIGRTGDDHCTYALLRDQIEEDIQRGTPVVVMQEMGIGGLTEEVKQVFFNPEKLRRFLNINVAAANRVTEAKWIELKKILDELKQSLKNGVPAGVDLGNFSQEYPELTQLSEVFGRKVTLFERLQYLIQAYAQRFPYGSQKKLLDFLSIKGTPFHLIQGEASKDSREALQMLADNVCKNLHAFPAKDAKAYIICRIDHSARLNAHCYTARSKSLLPEFRETEFCFFSISQPQTYFYEGKKYKGAKGNDQISFYKSYKSQIASWLSEDGDWAFDASGTSSLFLINGQDPATERYTSRSFSRIVNSLTPNITLNEQRREDARIEAGTLREIEQQLSAIPLQARPPVNILFSEHITAQRPVPAQRQGAAAAQGNANAQAAASPSPLPEDFDRIPSSRCRGTSLGRR